MVARLGRSREIRRMIVSSPPCPGAALDDTETPSEFPRLESESASRTRNPPETNPRASRTTRCEPRRATRESLETPPEKYRARAPKTTARPTSPLRESSLSADHGNCNRSESKAHRNRKRQRGQCALRRNFSSINRLGKCSTRRGL